MKTEKIKTSHSCSGAVNPFTLGCGLGGLTHPLAVQVVHGLGDGEEHSAGLPLREEFLPQDPVQQLPPLHQLCDQVDESAIIIHLGRGLTQNTLRAGKRQHLELHMPKNALLPQQRAAQTAKAGSARQLMCQPGSSGLRLLIHHSPFKLLIHHSELHFSV